MIIDIVQEFYTFFQRGKPVLSIDYGIKKTGIAISTPDHKISLPLSIITDLSDKKKVQTILKIIKSKNICAIVIGLPFNMDGTKSDQTIIVENFVKKLCTQTNLPIFMQDERLTSKAADNLLKQFQLSRKIRNTKDDLAASSMILESTLNSIQNLLLTEDKIADK